MTDADPTEDTAQLFPKRVGEKLRDRRVEQNLDLDEIAARTRIPLRHLKAIEESEYSTLPSKTYAIGFVKAYARAIDADEVKLSRELREEISETYEAPTPRPEPEFHVPRRVPTGGIVIVGIIVVLILAAGAALYFGSSLFRGAEAPASKAASSASELGLNGTGSTPVTVQPTPTPTPVNGGQVTLLATDKVWVRIYDAKGKTLDEKVLEAGDRYDVPQGADDPMINIGRPEAVKVLINGSEVAPLGPAGRAVKDVKISADALRARTPSGTPTPAAQ